VYVRERMKERNKSEKYDIIGHADKQRRRSEIDFFSSSLTDSVFPTVNFINVLRTNFSSESALSSFSLITFWLCN